MTPGLDVILADMQVNPRAFVWYGKLDPIQLRSWAETRGFAVPPDLFDLWSALGGGEMFESEEILAPFGAPPYAAAFDDANEHHRSLGLPQGLFLFHEGTWLSAVRRDSSRYVTLDRRTYSALGEFESLAAWYRATIRREFALRYGI